jgi:hypothetical protein
MTLKVPQTKNGKRRKILHRSFKLKRLIIEKMSRGMIVKTNQVVFRPTKPCSEIGITGVATVSAAIYYI